MQKIITVVCVGVLAGCSSGADRKVYVPLDGTGTTQLASSIPGATILLNRDTNELTYNGVVGQINAEGDAATFADGSTMAISGLENEYSRLFVLSGAESAIGVYGVDTVVRDVPLGSASYGGESIVVVTAPEGIFDLKGNVDVDVDFRDRNADVTLDDLSGTQFTGFSDPENIDDFGSISVTGITLSGGGLAGGSAVVATSETDAFGDAPDGGVTGSLFGPDAEEVGGSINLSGDGAELTGGFIARQ